GPTTSPGLEPGPSTDGIPDGPRQTAVWRRHGQGLLDLALTKPPSPPCRCGPGRRADYLPVCRGSVDLADCPELASAGCGTVGAARAYASPRALRGSGRRLLSRAAGRRHEGRPPGPPGPLSPLTVPPRRTACKRFPMS